MEIKIGNHLKIVNEWQFGRKRYENANAIVGSCPFLSKDTGAKDSIRNPSHISRIQKRKWMIASETLHYDFLWFFFLHSSLSEFSWVTQIIFLLKFMLLDIITSFFLVLNIYCIERKEL